MNNFEFLHNALNKKIVFTKNIEDFEMDFDENMAAKVISYDYKSNEKTFIIYMNFKEYEEENRKFEKANYWDKNNCPTLKWSETSYYPKDGKIELYFDSDLNISDYFNIVE